jgi:hypothetical protein
MKNKYLLTKFYAIVAMIILCVSGNTFSSPVIDNINGNATTPFLSFATNTAGWVYTPTFSYNIDGIFSTFDNVGSPTQQGPVASRVVTLSVFDKNPSGSLLATTTFVADGSGGNLGGNFPPVLLLAGHDYFIAYDNIYNLGLNIANWMPNQAAGTVNLNGWYTGTDWSTYYPQYIKGVLQVFSAPILRFEGSPVSSTPPLPSISLNGSMLTIQMTAGANQGQNADWWLVANAPGGHWYSYHYPNSWVHIESNLSGLTPAYQGPLVDIAGLALFDTNGIPSGQYIIYFGVDTNMNGVLDYNLLHYTSFTLNIP